MKQFFTLSLLLFSFSVFSQRTVSKDDPAPAATSETNAVTQQRTSATSSQIRTSEPAKLPYDVNDKYMGRAAEFIGNLTVSELPHDFPVYEKQWSLKEYNQVVLAFYYNHMDIVREPVKEKLKLLQH
jgi:hypothetical protein